MLPGPTRFCWSCWRAARLCQPCCICACRAIPSSRDPLTQTLSLPRPDEWPAGVPAPHSLPTNGNSAEVVGQVGNLRRVGNPPEPLINGPAGAGYPLGRAQDTILPHNEEHTSELQSLRHLVCRLLLEKKK